jgi:hypothetical protein
MEFLVYTVARIRSKTDDRLRQSGEEYRIDDKTVFVIKRNWAWVDLNHRPRP